MYSEIRLGGVRLELVYRIEETQSQRGTFSFIITMDEVSYSIPIYIIMSFLCILYVTRELFTVNCKKGRGRGFR